MFDLNKTLNACLISSLYKKLSTCLENEDFLKKLNDFQACKLYFLLGQLEKLIVGFKNGNDKDYK